MEAYLANLLREKNATTFVIVRDDAASSGLKRKPEFKDPMVIPSDHTKQKWQQSSSSFKDGTADTSAPTLPARRESSNSLYLLSSLVEEENLQKRGFLGKFHAVRRRTMKRCQKEVGPAFETSSSSGDDCANDDSQLETKKKRNSWDDLRLSPISRLNGFLKNKDPPTLPLRKQSGDNLCEQSTLTETPKRKGPRRNSMDGFVAPTNDLRQGCYLDNKVLINAEQRSSPLGDALLLSDKLTRENVQRTFTLDKGSGTPSNSQRSGSLDNALLSIQQDFQLPESYAEHVERFENCSNTPSISKNLSKISLPERKSKPRVKSTLNSPLPRWSSTKKIPFQLSSSLFQLLSLDNEYISVNDSEAEPITDDSDDDFRFGPEESSLISSSPLPPSRQFSNLEVSVKSFVTMNSKI